MAKILFTILPMNDLGLLTRALPIAQELKALGHAIVFCSPARAPGQLLRRAGFDNLVPPHPFYEFMATGHGIRAYAGYLVSGRWKARYGNLFRFLSEIIVALPLRNAPATSQVWNAGHACAQMGMLNRGFVQANCEAWLELMKECEADVIVDFWNPFSAVAARALGKPIVSVIQADAHPAGNGFMWWKQPDRHVPDVMPVFNRVVERYQLAAIERYEDLSVGDMTLVVGTPETDPLPEDAAVTYIGAVLWQNASDELPAWMDGLSRARSLVWVYSGNPRYSSGHGVFDSGVVIRACIEALAGEDLQVVLTTGLHELPQEYRPLPANFIHETYVPGLSMAERSDVMIHHGGYGSCQTGLYTGTPAVIIPTYSERESNARRVAGLGAGICIPVREDRSGNKMVSAQDVHDAVRRILRDESYLRNAGEMRGKMRRYGGAPQAAQLIDGFCRERL